MGERKRVEQNLLLRQVDGAPSVAPQLIRENR